TVGTAPPGGGGSQEASFDVVNPTPALTALTPASVPVNSSATPLTITGTSFQSGSTITFDGAPVAATFVNATTLTTTIPLASLATSGTFPVLVTNPTPGGGASAPIAFTVSNPNVTLSSVAPSTILYGSASTPITLVGSGFVSASAVSYNGVT